MTKLPQWREASVLLLPVLALAGVAGWMQSRASKNPPRDESGPFRLVVQRVERQDATARDVAEGFDTRFVVSFDYKGRRPEHWGQAHSGSVVGNLRWLEGGQWRKAGHDRSAHRSLVFDAASGSYASTFAARLADVAPRQGELRTKLLIGAWGATQTGQTYTPAGAIPESDFEFTARRPGERIVRPQVSHVSPLRVQKVDIQRFTLTNVSSVPEKSVPAMEVVFSFHLPGPPTGFAGLAKREPQILRTFKGSYFEDERGRRFLDSRSYSGSSHFEGTFRRTFEIPDLPKAHRLTWHTRVGLDESWPTDIKALLWDKTRQPAKS